MGKWGNVETGSGEQGMRHRCWWEPVIASISDPTYFKEFSEPPYLHSISDPTYFKQMAWWGAHRRSFRWRGSGAG